MTITAKDAEGNTTTHVSGATSLSVDDGSITPTSIAEGKFTDDGVWIGKVTLTKSGERTITVTNSGKTGSDTITVEAGEASYLIFTQQPTDILTRSAISPPVTVELRDEWDNVRISDNTTKVAITIKNNPGGGTLSGTVTRSVSNGIATFNDLSIDEPGNGYTLNASSAGLTSVTSSAFNVTAGRGNKVRIEDKADGSGVEIDTMTLFPGESFTAFAISRDKYGNFVRKIEVTWLLIDKTRGIKDSDLVSSSDKRSAVFTAHGGGTARIKAHHPVLGEDTTGIITVSNQPPAANAGPDQNVNQGDKVQLDGSSSHDPEGDVLSYKWIFHKKPRKSVAVLRRSSSVNPRFTVDKGGTYIVRLVVNDGSVDSRPDDVRIYVNSAPKAFFHFESETDWAPCKMYFDASSSRDRDGRVVSYKWNFGDGSAGRGIQAFHTYSRSGIHGQVEGKR